MDLFHLRREQTLGIQICRSRERGVVLHGGQSGKNLLKAAVCRLSACVLTHPSGFQACHPLELPVNNFLVADSRVTSVVPTLGYLSSRPECGSRLLQVWVALPRPPSLFFLPPPTVPRVQHTARLLSRSPFQAHMKGLCPTVLPAFQALSSITSCVYFGGLSRPPPAP